MRPRIYCASPLSRAAMWRPDSGLIDRKLFNITSAWHDSETVSEDDQDPVLAQSGWCANISEILSARYLLAYAEYKDRPSGTIIEIGVALGRAIPVYLVGNYVWGSWRTMCYEHETIKDALSAILTREGIKA